MPISGMLFLCQLCSCASHKKPLGELGAIGNVGKGTPPHPLRGGYLAQASIGANRFCNHLLRGDVPQGLDAGNLLCVLRIAVGPVKVS